MADSKCFKVILTLILMASQAAGLQSSLRENSTATDRGLSQGSPTRSLQVIDCEGGSYFEKAGASCKACHPTCKTCAVSQRLFRVRPLPTVFSVLKTAQLQKTLLRKL